VSELRCARAGPLLMLRMRRLRRGLFRQREPHLVDGFPLARRAFRLALRDGRKLPHKRARAA